MEKIDIELYVVPVISNFKIKIIISLVTAENCLNVSSHTGLHDIFAVSRAELLDVVKEFFEVSGIRIIFFLARHRHAFGI